MSHLTTAVSADDHALGPDDAPATLVEYGDYECPYCGEAYPVLKAVQHALGKQLRFVFRNFPLTDAHPHAGRAAEFAEAAASVGQFWAAHDMLYEHQDALDDESLIAYGRVLGIDDAALQAGFDGRFDPKIRHDFTSGVRSGVNGTPCLFINGERYDGPRDVDALVAVIRSAAKARA